MAYSSLISDLVITHAKGGLEYYKQKYKRQNILYTPHPKYDNIPKYNVPNTIIKYDIIIWGNVEPYKEVDKFLEYAINDPVMCKKKILICGLCRNRDYNIQINQLLTNNITFINRYLKEEELEKLIFSSKIIMFTYSSNSILSSGALVHSLPFKKPIIGPNIGTFKDYDEAGMIKTYNHFADIATLIEKPYINEELTEEHLRLNTWENFITKINQNINHKQ
jgi:hypothetical protein